MDFAHGAIQWLAADVATTTYTVSGLPFQPKALRFYWCGLQSAGDAATEVVSQRRGVGFAVGTSERRAVGSFSQDVSSSSNCGTVARNDAVACTTDGAGATDGLLDLNAINSDGFQLIVDNTAPGNITVFWEVWGGADITVAQVGDFAEPAASGNQDYTATGFVAGATDQVVMLAGVQSVAAMNTAEADASGMYVGCAASATAGDNIVVAGNAADANAIMNTDGYSQSDECLALCDKAGAAVANARAVLTQFGTDNFRLNWIERGVTDRKSIYMALKGGRWASGSTAINLATLGNTATVSGLPFTPIGMSLLWNGTAESTTDVFVASDIIGLGTGSSPSSRQSMVSRDEDAAINAEIDLVLEYDQVLCYANSSGTSGRAVDIDAMNSDGWRLIVDSIATGVTAWVGYLTFGSAPPSQFFSGDEGGHHILITQAA